jgi:hypothetical protein
VGIKRGARRPAHGPQRCEAPLDGPDSRHECCARWRHMPQRALSDAGADHLAS